MPNAPLPQVETELYGELKRDLGKNFKLFAETVNLKEWKKKGPYVPPEADMGSKRNAQAFPPLLTRWSLRQTKEVRSAPTPPPAPILVLFPHRAVILCAFPAPAHQLVRLNLTPCLLCTSPFDPPLPW